MIFNEQRERRAPTIRRSLALTAVALTMFVATACQPSRPPQNWQYNTVHQAVSSASFGAHHDVRYRFNGRRIEVVKSWCGADNWYSGLRYTGTCTARLRNGRLEVRWEWVWVKGSPPTARSQTYECNYNVSKRGKVTRLKQPNLLTLPCGKFRS